ncbi:MAG: CHASE3 domain-containing protein, partial [Verrucomicrobiota bacterium]|nr:CHASE3 domain-containing protein [Verrucomicrobiota bacterium]
MRSKDDCTQETVPNKVPSSVFARAGQWLFSQRHFHVKLLSGTFAGVIAIIVFAGFFGLTAYRAYRQEILRAHTVSVMRMSSVVLNDVAILETTHRTFILTGKPSYLQEFEEARESVKRRVDQLTDLIVDSPAQRKRVLKVQDVVQRWLQSYAVPTIALKQQKAGGATTAQLLGNPILDESRDLLQALQNEEQIILNGRMRDQEWAAQSTQILDVLPKLERSVVEMQKEKDGYL